MIKNASNEELDLFIVYARPEPKINESSSTLINGRWFVQTLGEPSEVLKIKVVARWDVLQQLLGYSKTKEFITVEFLDFVKEGFILNTLTYDIGEADETNPTYIITFELAVIPDV